MRDPNQQASQQGEPAASTSRGGHPLAGFSLAFIGIGLFRFWYQYNLYNLHSTTDYGAGIAWVNILRGLIAALLLAYAVGHVVTQRARSALVWASLILMTVSSVLRFMEIVSGDFSIEVARYVTCGLGLVWGYAMWMDLFSKLRPARAFMCLLMGLSLSCVLSLICAYLPVYAMGLVNLFVPAFAVLTFWYAMFIVEGRTGWVCEKPQVDETYSHEGRPKVIQLACALFTFAFVLGIALGFPDGAPRELPQTVRSLHQLFIVCVLVLTGWLVLGRGRRFSFPVVWCFENALLIAAIVMLISEAEQLRTLATAIMLTAESFFYSFVFFTSHSIGQHTRRSQTFVMCALYGLAILGMGVGRLLSYYTTGNPNEQLVVVVVMSVLVVIELVLGLLPTLFPGRLDLFAEVGEDARALAREAGALAQAGPALTPDSASSLDALRQRLGLTETETRIAGLIAAGRSRAVIARDLGYSENTIRNYTRTLYQKAGVHSKQELIDLIEEPRG